MDSDMGPEGFAFAFYLSRYLDDRTWIALRRVSRAWCRNFESLCDSSRIMMRFGRPLGGNLANVGLDELFECSSIDFRREVTRAVIAKHGPVAGIRLLPALELTHETVNTVFENFDRVVARMIADRASYSEYTVFALAGEDTLKSLAFENPTAAVVAFDRGISIPGAYIIRDVGCPRLLPQEQHGDFMRRALSEMRWEWVQWGRITCLDCARAVLARPHVRLDVSCFDCLARNGADDELLRVALEWIPWLRIRNAYLREPYLSYLKRACAIRPDLIRENYEFLSQSLL